MSTSELHSVLSADGQLARQPELRTSIGGRSYFHRLRFLLALAIVLGSYITVSTQLIGKPAIYLDEINPDYLAVKILHAHSNTAAWTMPGNYYEGRFPLFLAGAPYHSSWHAYLQVPFLATLGASIVSFRLSHVFLGILLLSAFFVVVARVSRSPAVAMMAGCVLGVDPAFVFAFRTQGYVVLFPALLVLLGILLCCRDKSRDVHFFGAGILFGLSAWGYFVYFLAIPGFLLAVYLRKGVRNVRLVTATLLGVVVGVIPYIVAYAGFVLHFGSLRTTLQWLGSMLHGMNRIQHDPGASTLSSVLLTDVTGVVERFLTLMTGEWSWEVIFGLWHKEPGQYIKVAVLVILPLVIFAVKRFRQNAGRDQRNALLLATLGTLSYLLLCAPFGGFLLTHHYHPLLPLCYFSGAISASVLIANLDHKFWLILVPALILMGCNLRMTETTFKQLRDAGGTHYYSHVVTDYALEEAKTPDVTPHVFADWGGMLQFIYLTEGRIPTYDLHQLSGGPGAVTDALCRLGKAKLIFIGDDAKIRAESEMQSDELPVLSERTIVDKP